MNLINNGKHIDEVMERTECKTHRTHIHIPCWNIIHPITGTFRAAVCNARIKAAGFDGPISPSSLQLYSAGSRGDVRGKRS